MPRQLQRRFQRDFVPEPDHAAFEDARPQTTAVDERSQHRLADQLLQVLAGRAILDAFEQHPAHPEALAEESLQAHPAGGQIAAVLVDAERDPVLRTQGVEDFGLEQRDLAGARIGRTGGVKAEAGEVPIASQAHAHYRFDFG